MLAWIYVPYSKILLLIIYELISGNSVVAELSGCHYCISSRRKGRGGLMRERYRYVKWRCKLLNWLIAIVCEHTGFPSHCDSIATLCFKES